VEETAYNGGMMAMDARYHLLHGTVDGEIYTIFAYSVDKIAKDIRHSITDRSECKFRGDFVSFKENKECKAILNGLTRSGRNGQHHTPSASLHGF
jgi:hypothetical protein